MTALRVSVIAGLLAGVALSPNLWLSSRLYPLTPVWAFLRPVPPPFDTILLVLFTGLAIAYAVWPRAGLAAALFLVLALAALEDQSRWQPWFYQYVLMLVAIALAGPARGEDASNTCRLIVAGTYLWSGLAKFNPNFARQVLPTLAGPLSSLPLLTLLPPVLETAIGAGLLTRRFRRAALIGAIAMHLFILLRLGPLGSRFNAVVWPWNLAMIAFLLILFERPAKSQAFRQIVWGNSFMFQRVVLVAFGLLPALSFVNLWDHYLSAAYYSGNRTSATMYFSDDIFERLPDRIADLVTDEPADLHGLDLNDWSWSELNVPSYPEPRVYRNVARQFCRLASEDPSVELVIQEKLALVNGGRRSVYHCADLRPPD